MTGTQTTINADKKQEKLVIAVNGKKVTLFFATEPNQEVAQLIKSTLLGAYLLKAI